MAAWSRIVRSLRGSAAAGTSSMTRLFNATAGDKAIVASLGIITSGTYVAWHASNELRDCLDKMESEHKEFLRNLESENREFLLNLKTLMQGTMEEREALLGRIRERGASEEEGGSCVD
uniref:Uncharacterized protein n=1 Tax=Leersia perrieri TaxID=77586 RepID=A0A0D9WKC5_9ORYZ